ncbi:hypothetical protein [Streptomyces sp. Inha503]|uniref:hypothetical protein n=1 Tax=Streptomyces sp. Inha503 TaxID=3383314 RepID=UPI0039A02E90
MTTAASQEAFLRAFHAERPAVTAEAFGRGRAPDGRSSYELPSPACTAWVRSMGRPWSGCVRPSIGDVAVIPDADGRLDVFALFGDGTIRCAWQNIAGNDNDWSAWHSLGVPESS